MSAFGWRAKAHQWVRVARRKTQVEERYACVQAARYCHGQYVRQIRALRTGVAIDAS
jgi:hypothetical protein